MKRVDSNEPWEVHQTFLTGEELKAMSTSDRHKQKRAERAKKAKKQGVMERAANKMIGMITSKMAKKSLDQNATTVIKVADRFNMPADRLRAETIKAAEQDIAIAIKEGKNDNDILQPAIDSPNYQKLLKRCGLNNEHLKVIIKEQRGKV